MRRLTKAVMGGSAVSAATVGGLLAAGVFATTTAAVVFDPTTPAANADSLTRFDSCGDLLRWYVDHSIGDVGPYGWGGDRIYPMYRGEIMEDSASDGGVVPQATAGKSPEVGVGSSATGTNTQEGDVDEPDIAKTDGRIVVRIDEQQQVVLTDVTGAEPRDVAAYPLPKNAFGGELLLVGDHLLINTSSGGTYAEPTDGFVGDRMYPARLGQNRLLDLDISDPAEPRLVGDKTYSGTNVSLRQYDDTVRLVSSTGKPELDFKTPGNGDGFREDNLDEFTRQNKQIVRDSTIEDWLPSVTDNLAGGDAKPLVDCTDVAHPEAYSGPDTITVVGYDIDRPQELDATAITASGEQVYSSADRLYVSSTRQDEVGRFWRGLEDKIRGKGISAPQNLDVRTQIHAFALKGTEASYVGSGHVSGSIRDRWSFDEHAGNLRVAVAYTNTTGATVENGIVILSERDGRLVEISTLKGLGVEENIQSVRWFDDYAVLVTFRQMDPLYTIDLSDPSDPKPVGELKIPGFSSYLHPIGGDLLLGLGTDANDEGRSLGAQAAVFDISDLRDPQRVSKKSFGENTGLLASDDPHAFTWLPGARTAVTGLNRWNIQQNAMPVVLIHVSSDGVLNTAVAPAPGGYTLRTLPLEDGRVALVGATVKLVTIR